MGNIKTYTVHFSDGDYDYVKAESPKAAYKKASKGAIGKFIKSINGYDNELTYYTVGNGFVDPHERIRKLVLEEDLSDDIEALISDMLHEEQSVYIGDGEYYCRLVYCAESDRYHLVDGDDQNKIYRTFKVNISFEEEKPRERRKHEWSNGKCIHCGADLFEVADPNGFCV